jgi:Tfp pilus assembly protein PilO
MRLQISSRERKLIAATLISVEAVLIYILLIKPKLAELSAARVELSSQLSIYESMMSKTKLLPILEDSHKQSHTEYLAARSRFFTSGEMESFVKTFASLARGSMVDLVGISPYHRAEPTGRTNLKDMGDIREQKLEIIMKGNYDRILSLLSQIESEPKAIVIDEMAFRRPPRAKRQVEITMIVTLYWISQNRSDQA